MSNNLEARARELMLGHMPTGSPYFDEAVEAAVKALTQVGDERYREGMEEEKCSYRAAHREGMEEAAKVADRHSYLMGKAHKVIAAAIREKIK